MHDTAYELGKAFFALYARPTTASVIDIGSMCFEHDPMFWVTFLETLRVLRPGGYAYLNVPSNYGWFSLVEQADGLIYPRLCKENPYACTDILIGRQF
jgi:hypothetical protein